MSMLNKMISSAQKAMIHVMNLNKDDVVLVITDNYTKMVGEAFYKAAIEYGSTAKLFFLPKKSRPLKDVPQEMRDLTKGVSIVINVFKGFSEETPFRIKWVKLVHSNRSIRVGHGPSITKSMLIDGPMNIDYELMVKSAETMIKSFENAKIAQITAPGGTDIELHIEDRAFSNDAKITKEPYFSNLPCGEIWCGPIESKGEGVIVCDGSIGDIGKVKKPLKIVVKDGQIVTIQSEDQKLVEKIEELINLDEEARVIGELGIGLNPGAKLRGILLEDEKAIQTAHVAFGNNTSMVGGQNNSITHRDFLFYKPTIKVTYKDGSNKTIMKNGDFCY
ncbi:MAG: aminopeptidase [Candidatus Lokiarchaeota archaeon]|nr:aminopeptidase [Candidatus Lokiarchaeota archaeon]